MAKIFLFLSCFLIFIPSQKIFPQYPDSIRSIMGSVNDANGNPLPLTHIINLNVKSGTITDSSGTFKINAKYGDILLIKNLAFIDTAVTILVNQRHIPIFLNQKKYSIPEVKIFEWGSTYEDFKQALLKMPVQESLGEKLNLPRQNPDITPFYLDSEYLSSIAFLVSSPLNYLYYNYNKTEISRRKVYELNKDKNLIDKFNKLYSYKNISYITGLKDQALLDFMIYLETRFDCDYHCSEMEIITELFLQWDNYKKDISLKDLK
jgi:hypothetical protein